jgi:hypothetical protein
VDMLLPILEMSVMDDECRSQLYRHRAFAPGVVAGGGGCCSPSTGESWC